MASLFSQASVELTEVHKSEVLGEGFALSVSLALESVFFKYLIVFFILWFLPDNQVFNNNQFNNMVLLGRWS